MKPSYSAPMPQLLFTVGYEKRTIAEYIGLLRTSGVTVLLDVRETAWSHKPGFSKGSFARALAEAGIAYVHARYAGNPKWLRSTASNHAECLDWYAWYLDEFEEIVDAFDAHVAQLLVEGQRVAITCFERHAHDCHRSLLADRWAARAHGRRITHLATDGCRRLTAR